MTLDDLLQPRALLWILDDAGEAQAVEDPLVWAEWFEQPENRARRQVAYDAIGDIEVSTVFLGTDTSILGPPMLWETMTFAPQAILGQWRYATRAEAEEGHAREVERRRRERGERR